MASKAEESWPPSIHLLVSSLPDQGGAPWEGNMCLSFQTSSSGSNFTANGTQDGRAGAVRHGQV